MCMLHSLFHTLEICILIYNTGSKCKVSVEEYILSSFYSINNKFCDINKLN